MKVSPIPGFGSFGVYIDDIDMDYMTDEQWMEIGKIFIDEMVVVFRNIKMTKDQYVEWVYKWGPSNLILIQNLLISMEKILTLKILILGKT